MEADLDLPRAAFWLGVAAVIVAAIIAGAMRDRSLHRLIEASIEKTGTIDPRLAELLEKEIARKAATDANMWGIHGVRTGPGASVRKTVSSTIAIAGAFIGFLTFFITVGGMLEDSGLHPIMAVPISIGVGCAIAGVFGLIAWLIWPKKKSTDSEPLV